MLITSKTELGATVATVDLSVTINKKNHWAMNKAVFDTCGKTLEKMLEGAIERELEKAFDTARQAGRL